MPYALDPSSGTVRVAAGSDLQPMPAEGGRKLSR
jgi:hypothetical protein